MHFEVGEGEVYGLGFHLRPVPQEGKEILAFNKERIKSIVEWMKDRYLMKMENYIVLVLLQARVTQLRETLERKGHYYSRRMKKLLHHTLWSRFKTIVTGLNDVFVVKAN